MAARLQAAHTQLDEVEESLDYYLAQEKEAVLNRNYDLAEQSKEQMSALVLRYNCISDQVRSYQAQHI